MKKKEIFLISILFVFEELVKYGLETTLQNGPLTIIQNFFVLDYVHNKGAAWSILNNQTIILIIISLICLVFLTVIKQTIKESKLKLWATSLLYAGIMGNLIDRIVFGYVKDFFSFNIFGYAFPVFNCADIFIVLGALLLIINIWKEERINEK